jgi:hypothetical protein
MMPKSSTQSENKNYGSTQGMLILSQHHLWLWYFDLLWSQKRHKFRNKSYQPSTPRFTIMIRCVEYWPLLPNFAILKLQFQVPTHAINPHHKDDIYCGVLTCTLMQNIMVEAWIENDEMEDGSMYNAINAVSEDEGRWSDNKIYENGSLNDENVKKGTWTQDGSVPSNIINHGYKFEFVRKNGKLCTTTAEQQSCKIQWRGTCPNSSVKMMLSTMHMSLLRTTIHLVFNPMIF